MSENILPGVSCKLKERVIGEYDGIFTLSRIGKHHRHARCFRGNNKRTAIVSKVLDVSLRCHLLVRFGECRGGHAVVYLYELSRVWRRAACLSQKNQSKSSLQADRVANPYASRNGRDPRAVGRRGGRVRLAGLSLNATHLITARTWQPRQFMPSRRRWPTDPS